MKNAKTAKLMFRWSLLTSVLIAMVWGVWYFIEGSIPTLRYIRMTDSWTISLPFVISYCWSVVFGPLISVTLVSLLRSQRVNKLINDQCGSLCVLGWFAYLGSMLCIMVLGAFSVFDEKLAVWGVGAAGASCLLGGFLIGLISDSGKMMALLFGIFFGTPLSVGLALCNVHFGFGAVIGQIVGTAVSCLLVALIKPNYKKFFQWILVK